MKAPVIRMNTTFHDARLAVLLAVPLAFGATACQNDDAAKKETRAASAGTATIRVDAGNGRLAGGEVYEIAEWRSGKKGVDGLPYADFRGQDGGPTLDLRLAGLSGPGAFDCASGTAALELRVDAGATYRPAPDFPCRIELAGTDEGVLAGRYTATLRRKSDPRDHLTVTGTFRAEPSSSQSSAVINAAQAPKIGALR